MKDSKAIRKAKEKNLLESLKKIEHPHLTSLAIGGVLFILLVVAAVVAYAAIGTSFTSAMMTSGLVGLALDGAWLTLRLGLFSSWRLRFVNYRNKKIAKGIKSPVNVTFSKQEFNELAKRKSWYGMIMLLALCAISVIVTAAIRFA